jgi:hypothetical protein
MLKELDPRNGGFGVPLLALAGGAALLGLLFLVAPERSPDVANTTSTTTGSAARPPHPTSSGDHR